MAALAGQSLNDVIVAQMPGIATGIATGEKDVTTAEGKTIAETAIAEERIRDALLLNRGVTGPVGERRPRVGVVPARSAPTTSAPLARLPVCVYW